MIYLDHAATTPLHPLAKAALQEAFNNEWFNSEAIYRASKTIKKKIEDARINLLLLLQAHSEKYQLIFTGSATESNNLIVFSLVQKMMQEFTERNIVYLSSADHPSIVVAAKSWAKEIQGKQEIKFAEIPLRKDGTIDQDRLIDELNSSAIKGKVRAILLSEVNNTSGVWLQAAAPKNGLAATIKNIDPQIIIHLDCAQSFGKLPLSLQECNSAIDSLTISAHKMGGPKGIAALIFSKSNPPLPMFYGGNQEFSLRAGTVNYSSIASWLAVANQIIVHDQSSCLQRINELNEILRSDLVAAIPTIRYPFYANASKYILLAIIPEISSDILIRHLEGRKIYISSSAACSSQIRANAAPNATLTALGIDARSQQNTLRISLGYDTTAEDIKNFTKELVNIYQELKSLL